MFPRQTRLCNHAPAADNEAMNLDETLHLLARAPDSPIDVAELALHLARDEYPDLDVDAYLSEVNALAHEAGRFVRGDFDARVTGLCRYLFHDMGFHGNVKEYYDPRNSYFNQVLERRTGIPITLSAVMMAVGRRVGLDVVGVGLPGHFIVKVIGDGRDALVDPFHGGRRITPYDCGILVQQVTGREFEATPDALEPLPLGLMAQRMLGNLKGIYLQCEDYVRAARVMERARQLNPRDSLQCRDLGICYLRLEKPGKAIDLLAAYLTAFPEAEDAKTVGELLKQARRVVAGMN
jgi:regulator of sirC expression with transglutaminase-like and TPR domain